VRLQCCERAAGCARTQLFHTRLHEGALAKPSGSAHHELVMRELKRRHTTTTRPGAAAPPFGAPYVTPGNAERCQLVKLSIVQQQPSPPPQQPITLHLLRAAVSPTGRGNPPSAQLWRCALRILYKDKLDSETERLSPCLVLFVGRPVVVTHNVAVAAGIANGTKAPVTRLLWPPAVTFIDTFATVHSVRLPVRIASAPPVAVVVRVGDSLPFAPPANGCPGVPLLEREFPITPRTATVRLRHLHGLPPTASLGVSLQQFPLVARFALTCYKVQGDTLHDGLIVAHWRSPSPLPRGRHT
jgi:hypothetical protein